MTNLKIKAYQESQKQRQFNSVRVAETAGLGKSKMGSRVMNYSEGNQFSGMTEAMKRESKRLGR